MERGMEGYEGACWLLKEYVLACIKAGLNDKDAAPVAIAIVFQKVRRE